MHVLLAEWFRLQFSKLVTRVRFSQSTLNKLDLIIRKQKGLVAQWESGWLLTSRSRVRTPPFPLLSLDKAKKRNLFGDPQERQRAFEASFGGSNPSAGTNSVTSPCGAVISKVLQNPRLITGNWSLYLPMWRNGIRSGLKIRFLGVRLPPSVLLQWPVFSNKFFGYLLITKS